MCGALLVVRQKDALAVNDSAEVFIWGGSFLSVPQVGVWLTECCKPLCIISTPCEREIGEPLAPGGEREGESEIEIGPGDSGRSRKEAPEEEKE